MAEPDHTALARLSGLPDYLFEQLPGAAPDRSDKDEKALREIFSAIADIDQVKRVITRLLADSDAFREVCANGAWVEPLSWPLPASTYASLLVAIHFLNQCADMLRRDLHG
jgi:hypothetical protein